MGNVPGQIGSIESSIWREIQTPVTLQTAKAELVDLQSEQQREMEGLLDNVRSMTRELRLQMLAIDSFVPADYQVRHRI